VAPAGNDIVVSTALKLEQSEIGFGPLNAIAAFRITRDFRIFVIVHITADPATAIIHPIEVRIFQHSHVSARGRALPRLVKTKDDLFLARVTEHEPHILHRFDEVAVDKKLRAIGRSSPARRYSEPRRPDPPKDQERVNTV